MACLLIIRGYRVSPSKERHRSLPVGGTPTCNEDGLELQSSLGVGFFVLSGTKVPFLRGSFPFGGPWMGVAGLCDSRTEAHFPE